MTTPRASQTSFLMATVVAFLCFLSAVPGLAAERAEPLPAELEGVGIVQRVGAPLPLELTFTDEEGRQVRLGEYFRPGLPVLLNLGYYRCPMLCNLVLNGLVETLRELPHAAGEDYELIMVSIDPLETPELAGAKKQNYVEDYGRPGAGPGWHFLVGAEANIRALADAVGFGYRYIPETREYAHTAAIIVATPEGSVSHYLTGILYEPRTVRLALAEASSGEVGSTFDQVLLFCFHYDAASGRYAPAARRLMSLGGAATVVVLAATLSTLWVRERRRRGARTGSGS